MPQIERERLLQTHACEAGATDQRGAAQNNNRFCFKQQQVLFQTTTGFVSARSHSRLTWKLGQGRPHQVDVVFLGEGLADHVAVG